MKKRFVFEIEQGTTKSCLDCPFGSCTSSICGFQDYIDCSLYNMATIKLIEDEEDS